MHAPPSYPGNPSIASRPLQGGCGRLPASLLSAPPPPPPQFPPIPPTLPQVPRRAVNQPDNEVSHSWTARANPAGGKQTSASPPPQLPSGIAQPHALQMLKKLTRWNRGTKALLLGPSPLVCNPFIPLAPFSLSAGVWVITRSTPPVQHPPPQAFRVRSSTVAGWRQGGWTPGLGVPRSAPRSDADSLRTVGEGGAQDRLQLARFLRAMSSLPGARRQTGGSREGAAQACCLGHLWLVVRRGWGKGKSILLVSREIPQCPPSTWHSSEPGSFSPLHSRDQFLQGPIWIPPPGISQPSSLGLNFTWGFWLGQLGPKVVSLTRWEINHQNL